MPNPEVPRDPTAANGSGSCHAFSPPLLQALEEIEQKLPNMPWAERLLVSAATGQRCSKIFQKVIAADKSRRSVMPILELNDAVFDIMRKKPPISPAARKGGRVYYSEQVMTKPPKVVLAVNSADLFSDNYKYAPPVAQYYCLPAPLPLTDTCSRHANSIRSCRLMSHLRHHARQVVKIY